MLLLVDTNNIAYRAYFSSRLTTTEGKNVGIPFLGLRALSFILDTLQPTHCVCAWDGGKSKTRTALYPLYKAQRQAQRASTGFDFEDFVNQCNMMRTGLETLGVDQVFIKGYEADDIIAVLQKYIREHIVICSTDKDYLQLVSPHVSFYDLAKETIVTPVNFKDFIGVDTPKKYLLARAISGDASDNIQGLNRVGLKTAIKLMNKYNTIYSLSESREVKAKDPQAYQTIARNLTLMDLAVNPDKLTLTEIITHMTCGVFNRKDARTYMLKNEFKSLYMCFDDFSRPYAKLRPTLELLQGGENN